MKTQYEVYTEHELVKLFTDIWCINFLSEEEHSALVEHFLRITEHPDGLQLTVYIEAGIAKDPQDVIRIVNEWRLANGKPGYKTS
ncbi:bacteriocin immunity protein [Pseudomonas lundensis]|uniref:bacteriocin immunity protein n=1 Tax=Pseudomonas lundensis TaxID=86185 RepID=UPI0035246829